MITVSYTIGSRNIYLTRPGHFVIVCGTNHGDLLPTGGRVFACFKHNM